MYKTEDLLAEAQEALERTWFITSVRVIERTESAASLRLYIRSDLFIQAFAGELSDSLYFALIGDNQRIFGIDRIDEKWHLHPYKSTHEHIPLSEPLEPKPLLKFLSRVEKLLLEHNLL
jgi:hypothetical protein